MAPPPVPALRAVRAGGIGAARPGIATAIGKRTLDVVGAAIGLLVLSPVLLVVSIAVLAPGRGGVLFRQTRVGLRGKPFTILKFRTMTAGADDELMRLLRDQGRGDEPLFKVDHDPRITRLGRFLRRYSLDELPQLVNVLIGQMSLVGPRPQRAEEVALYDAVAAERLAVRPGLTGLWQVSGRSRLGWSEALELDLEYARNVSVWLDVTIIVRTFAAVLRADGAV